MSMGQLNIGERATMQARQYEAQRKQVGIQLCAKQIWERREPRCGQNGRPAPVIYSRVHRLTMLFSGGGAFSRRNGFV